MEWGGGLRSCVRAWSPKESFYYYYFGRHRSLHDEKVGEQVSMLAIRSESGSGDQPRCPKTSSRDQESRRLFRGGAFDNFFFFFVFFFAYSIIRISDIGFGGIFGGGIALTLTLTLTLLPAPFSASL